MFLMEVGVVVMVVLGWEWGMIAECILGGNG
jgi:hypothetical protein